MNFAIRLYRALARAFPHEFQMAYGTDGLWPWAGHQRDAGRVVLVNGVSIPYIDCSRQQHGLFAGAAAFQIAVPYNVSPEYCDYRRTTSRAVPGVF